MDQGLKSKFIQLWNSFFGEEDLPFTFYYCKEPDDAVLAGPVKGRSCLICELSKVRNGETRAYNVDTIACGGAKRFLGFTETIRPDFEYFLSCGIPGKMEGERYIKTPEMVLEIQRKQNRILEAADKYIVFKRWDNLREQDNPDVVIFYAKPDVLSGLFTLANYDQTEPDSTIAPFAPGCGSIVYYPYMEKNKERPRAVLGMFDPSARPCVPKNYLSFSVPMVKFEKMIGYMEESFLITHTWKNLQKRIHQD